MPKCDPYVSFPRELWNNIVVFSNIVGADVYLVLLKAVQDHMQAESSNWTNDQKREFARQYSALNRLSAQEDSEQELEQDDDIG